MSIAAMTKLLAQCRSGAGICCAVNPREVLRQNPLHPAARPCSEAAGAVVLVASSSRYLCSPLTTPISKNSGRVVNGATGFCHFYGTVLMMDRYQTDVYH
jgi:hypothetical protein